MKKILIALAVIATLTGCKASNKPQVVEDLTPIKVPKERNFTAAELIMGKRVCGALKNKRELFEVITNMQEKFRLRGELKNCEIDDPHNIKVFNAAISNASSTDFEYVAEDSVYFRDVVTDQTGVMKQYCDGITGSDSVSNQILSGSSYIRLNLLISDGYDKLEIVKLSKELRPISLESLSIITQKTQADPKFFGVEKERIRYTLCSDPKKTTYVKQTWISAVTPF